MKYLVFSDESNHDKSITRKEEENFDLLNIDKENQSREYTRSYAILQDKYFDEFESYFVESENSLRNINRSNNEYEIKASQSLKISGKDGIKNVEEKYVTHSMKTLTLLEKFEMKVILVNYNKIEYVVEKSINLNLERLQKINTLLNKETIIYSYAKYFQNHYTNNLLQLLFTEATGVTDYKIKREMTRINQDLKKYPLKKNEVLVGNTMIKFLEEQLVSFKTKKYYSWDYELETDKIIELIQMNNKDVYSFIFDKGTKATKIFKRKVSENEYVESVREDESKELVMLRFVDWVATFFGKLLRSYANSFKMDTKSEKELALNTVADLERNWFDLSANQFKLIKLIGGMITNKKILFLQGYLADNSLGLSNYFEYISEYETYEEFRKIDLYKHGQKNNFRLNFLWEKFYFENNILFDTKYTTDGVTTEYARNRKY